MTIVTAARAVTCPTLTLALLLTATPSLAQTSPCIPVAQGPVAFDPYKPSHLAIVRNYGGAIMSQAPLDTLLKLDPYVPTEGELLRQIGRGIPWWPYPAYTPYFLAPQVMPCVAAPAEAAPAVADQPPPLTTFSDMLAALQRQSAPAPPAAVTPAERLQGIAIDYEGRRWISAGAAVPFVESAFVRVGERSGSPVFRPARGAGNVIYIPTAPGMVAPFRAAPPP